MTHDSSSAPGRSIHGGDPSRYGAFRAPPTQEMLKRRQEVAARIKAEQGNSRPLANLAHKEGELHEQPMLRRISNLQERGVDPDLLTHQLTRSVNTAFVSDRYRNKVKIDALSLFGALRSEDATESILDRLIVGLTNIAMDCIDRSSLTSDLRARDVNLRYAMKGAASVGFLIKLRDERRGRGQQNANGVQAVLDTLRTRKPEYRKEPPLPNKIRQRKKRMNKHIKRVGEDANGSHPQT